MTPSPQAPLGLVNQPTTSTSVPIIAMRSGRTELAARFCRRIGMRPDVPSGGVFPRLFEARAGEAAGPALSQFFSRTAPGAGLDCGDDTADHPA